MIVNLDIETRSELDLNLVGGYRYAEHPSTESLCYSYKIDDAPEVSVLAYPDIADGYPPRELQDAILDGATVRGWNLIGFDRLVWNTQYGGAAYISLDQCDDTMDRARVFGLPAKLENAARFLGLNIRKDMEGHQLMMRLCKASNPEPTGVELDRLAKYCRTDVELEALLASVIPPLPDWEVRIAQLSHQINDRGFAVDLELAQQAVAFADTEMLELSDRITELTDGVITKHTQRERIFNWLKSRKVKLPNLQKQTLEDLLETVHDDKAREVIDIRLSGAKASTAKFNAAVHMACADGRVRGTFVYFGAPATGRWSGRGIQPHNLPRETASDPYGVLDDIRNKQVPSVYKALSSLLRPLIVAPEGKLLVRCDFSAIEGRVVAWLANDKAALSEYQGEGKMYELAASKIYKVHPSAVTKEQRQIGKVSELALGFGGGPDAFLSMAKNYGVKVPHSQAKDIVTKWRAGRPAVTALWKEVERCAIQAHSAKGKPAYCCGKRVMMITDPQKNLWIQLPSSRYICLPRFNVAYEDGYYGPESVLSYARGNWLPKKGVKEWPRATTYGGSLVESLAQGIARDLLAVTMDELSGYDIVLHVHDEAVIECDEDEANEVLSQMEGVMSIAPRWAKGLPLAAVGEISRRFGK